MTLVPESGDAPDVPSALPDEPGVWDGVERRSPTNRRRHRVYRFIDRRHGFDRRKRYPVTGAMRDRPWILVAVIVAMNLLSLVDGYFTAGELQLGLATEGNPILDAIARESPLYAIAVKVGAVLVASVVIWLGRRRHSILVLALVALAVFAGLAAYHWTFLSALGYL